MATVIAVGIEKLPAVVKEMYKRLGKLDEIQSVVLTETGEYRVTLPKARHFWKKSGGMWDFETFFR